MATQLAEPTATTTRGRQWLRLQRGVAAGQILVFLGIMLLVRGQYIPPLAIAAGLFAAGAILSRFTARMGAIAIGVMSALWLAMNVAFSAQVVPDLRAVAVTEIFVPTFAMNVLALAGTIGLVGTLRRAPGKVATSTMRVAVALMAAGTVMSIVARLV